VHVKRLRVKYSDFFFTEIMIFYLHPASCRGRTRGRHDTWGGERWPHEIAAFLVEADERSRCGRSSCVVLASRCWRQGRNDGFASLRVTGARTPVPGESAE
jgi:hypothetical protein